MSHHDQPKPFFAPLFWTMVTVLLTTTRPVQCGVSCEAGHFHAGGPGKVTCNFGKDVSGPTKHNFNIIQYRTLQSEENYILLCNWSPATLECTIKNGYSFDKSTVSDTLVLNIPNLQVSMGGIYVCHLVPADDRVPVDTCQLNVTEPPTTPEAPTTPIPPTTPATTTSKNETIVPVAKNQGAEDSGGDNTGVIVGVLVPVLVIVVVVVVVAYVVLRRKYIAKRRQETQNGSEQQDCWTIYVPCCGPPGSPKNSPSVESHTGEVAENAENETLLSNENTNATICKVETPNTCSDVNEVDVGKRDVDVDVSEGLAEYKAEGKANGETKDVGGDGVAGDGGMGKMNQAVQPQLPPATNANDAAANIQQILLDLETNRANQRLRLSHAQRNGGQPMSVHSTQPGAHTTVNEDITNSKPSGRPTDEAEEIVGGQGEVNNTTQPLLPPTNTIASAANDSRTLLDRERKNLELEHQGDRERHKLDIGLNLQLQQRKQWKGAHATPPGLAPTAGSPYNTMTQTQQTAALGTPLSTTTVSSGYNPVNAPYTVSNPSQGSSQSSSTSAPGQEGYQPRNDLSQIHGVGRATGSTAGSDHNSTATANSPNKAQVSPQGSGQVLNQPRNDLPQTHGTDGAGLSGVNVDNASPSQPAGSIPVQAPVILKQPTSLSMSPANPGNTSGQQGPGKRPAIQPSRFQQPLNAPFYGTTQPDSTNPQPGVHADPQILDVSASLIPLPSDSDDEGAVQSSVNPLNTEDAPDYKKPIDKDIDKEFNLDNW